MTQPQQIACRPGDDSLSLRPEKGHNRMPKDSTMQLSKHDRHARFGSGWLGPVFGPLALTALLALVPADDAFAQGAVKSVHKDWQIRCDTPPGAKAEQCALIQSVTAEDRANVGLTVIVLKTADQKSRLMRVVAPLGVLLPSGLGLKIDQADIGRAGFVRCLPNGCIAEVIMARFSRGYPAVELSVICEPSVGLLERIDANEIDLAIVTNCESKRASETFRRERLLWVTSNRHSTHLEERMPLALGRPSCTWRRIAIERLEAIGRPFRVLYSSSNAGAVAAAVLAGLAVSVLPESGLRPGMHAEDNKSDRDESRNHRDPEHGGKIVRKRRHEHDRQQRSDHRADGVDRLTQPIGAAAQIGRREIGYQRIARRAADALADAVDEACRCQPANTGGERKHRLGHCGKTIAECGEPLALAQIVTQCPGKDLGYRGRGLGDAFDDPDRQC